MKSPESPIQIKTNEISAFCSRWKIREFGFLCPASHPRLMGTLEAVIAFDPVSTWDMFDMVQMRDELASHLDFPIRLIEEVAVRNPYFIDAIRRTKKVIYAA